MPRSAGIYSKPFPDVVEGTTIESAVHNGTISDIEVDLNTPRPIIAGGTSANNAHEALINLHGEETLQEVTNYDTFPFVSGSFFSEAGATSAPNGSAFVGICYTPRTAGYAIIEARETTGAGTVGNLFIREKSLGAWGAWKQQSGSVADMDARYVNISGDVMTGSLGIASTLNVTGNVSMGLGGPGTVPFVGNINGSSGTGGGGHFTWNKNGVTKWVEGFASSIFGIASDNYALFNSTAGTNAVQIDAGTNLATFGSNILVGGNGSTGTVYFSNNNTKYLRYDGTNFNLAGGALIAPQAYVIDTVTAGGGGATGTYLFGNTGGKSLSYDGTNFNMVGGGQLSIAGGLSATGRVKIERIGVGNFPPSGAYALTVIWGPTTENGIGFRPYESVATFFPAVFFNQTDSQIGNIACTATATAYNTSSGAELKEDLKSFDAGNIIDATDVYDFKWKNADERAYGVIAQQAYTVYPTAVTHNEKDDWWGVDYSKYVPVLLQELKTLRKRVAELEGRIDMKPQPA
jgi:hypothetical protein